ncbi:hypothetical protein DAPPUDRAFT_238845 [Daphnia pulex]|uniref:Uncharacterized protein n=1 Tax=Daphnia pulex TaxID=6669 RepID=E9G7K5_DAPPU|nr:hypothetical protein DAPPUDRAFT_238845 [Daphnia pulex]|eukprot:EFX84483.1 hypothetical protein DAPPUDRAFT_238845 [Daphnia pulex]
MGSIKIVLILAILVAVAYTLETAGIPIVDNQDMGVAGSTIPEAGLPDLNAAEHKKKKYRGHGQSYGHSSGGGGGGGGSSEERR